MVFITYDIVLGTCATDMLQECEDHKLRVGDFESSARYGVDGIDINCDIAI